MNAQFHTPSFGDEVFAVTDLDSNTSANFEHHQQQQLQQSKRMRGSMDSSLDEYHTANDESFVGNNSTGRMASPTPTATATVASRKHLTPPSEQSEPAKPLSAYALFFRDTVSAIKQQNPNCAFQEISRIVASMWEALDPTHKNLYNKKNENAKNEYIRQMRSHRQQQLEQQQQQQHLTHTNAVTHPMQSKPAVFTISRTNSESDVHPFNNSASNTHQNMNSPQQQIHTQYQQQQQVHLYQQQYEFQQQPNFNHQQSQLQLQQHQHPQDQQQEEQQQQQQIAANCIDTSPPPAQQIQLLTEAGSVQKCIREHCTKRAIINPDWEDEYCSNECVVIHCRNVFNEWVESNLEARAQ